jgi:hypothetical protein
VIVARVNAALAGWVNYFRVGNSSRAFSEVRDYLEMKIRVNSQTKCNVIQGRCHGNSI